MHRMLKAGWPDMDAYCEGLAYHDKSKASDIHRDFLVEVCDLALDDYISETDVIRLGPCAKESIPRAMFLLGFIQEGGARVELPDYASWPTINPKRELA